jgi:hypothetical protein
METVRENMAMVPDRAQVRQELAPGAGTPTVATPLLRQTGYTDTSSSFQRPAKPPRAFPWLGSGIRIFILCLAAGLVVVVAHEWDW